MKIVVLGAGGLLGSHVVRAAAGAHAVTGLSRATCDVSDIYAVKHAIDGADAVVNCAAFAKVEAAESSPEARRTNAIGAENVALACRHADAKCVHISTDFVFDGTKGAPYDVDDEPRPQFAYARSKREGEERALDVGGRVYLVRVQSLYGNGGSNFPSKLVAALRAGAPLKLDCQRRAQPTWATVAAQTIVDLAARAPVGTYHVSCGGDTTWADFAQAACEEMGIARDIDRVSSSALGFRAARPASSVFSHRAVRAAGLAVTHWREALRAYLASGGGR